MAETEYDKYNKERLAAEDIKALENLNEEIKKLENRNLN
ncbi:MAG: hypothetical protein UV42_C0049G0007 [Candidatus Magasanikbacteria bacterium GW2011_GWE2_42_7]|uniref:Uncharacterized protein n=1 Tax=Candidatus Magasanikbacteria bacterium GW2011_GWE2_42_7 TaxID=1619052 RepID=A0A0G1BB75_9BACT|nr:MAG: hypothetical protein UV42_C0049G0007 [Candidatus Magasanikbacteria bacterium GW2011_GWE2_42_7]